MQTRMYNDSRIILVAKPSKLAPELLGNDWNTVQALRINTRLCNVTVGDHPSKDAQYYAEKIVAEPERGGKWKILAIVLQLADAYWSLVTMALGDIDTH